MMCWMRGCSLLACPNRAASCNCDPHIKRMFCVTQWYLITSVLIPGVDRNAVIPVDPADIEMNGKLVSLGQANRFFFQFLFFCINVKEILIKKGWSDNLVSDRSNKWCIYHSRNSLSGSRGQLQPTTLMCATQIHSGDTRTYVSVGELTTPTMPMGNIGILIFVVPVIRTRISE